MIIGTDDQLDLQGASCQPIDHIVTKAIVMIYKAQFHLKPLLPAVMMAFAALLLPEPNAFAEASVQSQLSILNRQSPVEPGAALGITGTSMGIGVRRVPIANAAVMAPSFHLVKGLWYPVDVGYSFSYIDDVAATLQSFFAQIELLAGLRWPSISVRVSYHTLTSLDWHRSKTLDAAAMITARGIPWTTLYAALGGSAHQIETDNSLGPFFDNFYTIGAKIAFPNPFVGWSIEHSHWPISGDSEVKIKTSFNI